MVSPQDHSSHMVSIFFTLSVKYAVDTIDLEEDEGAQCRQAIQRGLL